MRLDSRARRALVRCPSAPWIGALYIVMRFRFCLARWCGEFIGSQFDGCGAW